MIYALYTPDGKIDSIFSGDESCVSLQNMAYIPVSSEVKTCSHFVDTEGYQPVVREKTRINVNYTIKGLVVIFHGLPIGVTIICNGYELVTDDETTEIEFDIPGTYLIQFYPPVQYLDTELEVTVG